MFTHHEEISHKVRGPTHSENARHLFVWVYREHCVNILYAFERIIHSICVDFAPQELPLPPLQHATHVL